MAGLVGGFAYSSTLPTSSLPLLGIVAPAVLSTRVTELSIFFGGNVPTDEPALLDIRWLGTTVSGSSPVTIGHYHKHMEGDTFQTVVRGGYTAEPAGGGNVIAGFRYHLQLGGAQPFDLLSGEPLIKRSAVLGIFYTHHAQTEGVEYTISGKIAE